MLWIWSAIQGGGQRGFQACISLHQYDVIVIAVVTVKIVFECCTYYTGERSSDVNIEADTNDMTEHPLDDNPRPYVCVVCEKGFGTKQSLNRHKVMHTEEDWCSCTQCGKRFISQHYLKIHMNVHSSKYQCTECGKCCRKNEELTVHRRRHSGEKSFECTVCSKRFTTSGELVVHRRIHSGEKPYKCYLCDKVFSQFTSLNIHLRVHTGDKPYKCSLCDKSYSNSSNLQKHLTSCTQQQ